MRASITFARIAPAVALLVVFSGWAAAGQESPKPADPVGFQFLERLVVLVVKSAVPGASSSGDAGRDVVDLARDFKAVREAKRVDELFAVRYTRLLSAVRQGVISDPELLFWPMYRYNMIDFIEERTGRIPAWKDTLFIVNDHGGSGVGLGMLADAIMSEVVSLHIYLETWSKRQDILKSYLDKGMGAAGANQEAK
jgi:hypothetical protein